MRYVREFRDGAAAAALALRIAAEAKPEREYHLMEFCGGHTHAIFRYGVQDLLPPNVRLVHGPGCPVCVLPIPRLDMAIALARRPEVTLVSYGDMLRVPASRKRQSAQGARAGRRRAHGVLGAARRSTSPRLSRNREVVFFAIGFETTTPATAHVILEAKRRGLENFTRVLQPRADAGRDPEHPRRTGSARISAACAWTASSVRRT